MTKESKYYYITYYQFLYSSSNQQPILVKWNEHYYVDINENVEDRQVFNISIDKLSDRGFDKPKSTEFEKVKPILGDLFNDYYFLALRTLSAKDFKEGEYYIIKNRKEWIQVEYYPLKEKDRYSLSIDFNNNIKEFMLELNRSLGHKGRPNARKNGSPIEFEEFIQYLNLTLKFLADPDSYKVYLETYLKNFNNLVNGKNIVEAFDISSAKVFEKILNQLNGRKATVEKRLIEEDSDALEDRIKLRGELEGLNYAISTIKIHK